MSEPTPAVIASRYRLLELIGSGGMGRVFRAEHIYTGEALALKLLDANRSDDPQHVERFKREARASTLIRNEHVVRVVDADFAAELDGQPYLAMELLDGLDLAALVEVRGPLPAADVVEILGQAAIGLERAHAVGIVHRDLKPANVFLHLARSANSETAAADRQAGVLVKLLDFGLLKAASMDSPLFTDGAATSAGTLLGTPLYMAPEQARGAVDEVTPATDIWAVGQIAYELLAGTPYWDAGPAVAIMAHILSGPMALPSTLTESLPPGFDAWFARSCDRDPTARFSNAGEQWRALAAVLTPGPEPTVKTSDVARALVGPVRALRDEAATARASDSSSGQAAELAMPTIGGPGLAATQATPPTTRRASAQRTVSSQSERRQVTVLRFSAVLTRPDGPIDPEDFDEILTGFRAACVEVLGNQGEQTSRFAGVEHQVCFGYPTAYGNDAQRAVNAALEIVEATGKLDARGRAQRGISVAVRLGLHTGLVLTRDIDAPAADATIVGQALEVATSVEHAARVNRVTVSGATQRLVRGQFACRRVEIPAALSSLSSSSGDTLELYEIDSAAAPAMRDREGRVGLVGRDGELNTLLDRWERIESEGGQAVQLRGEAGIGKSRLLRAFREALADEAEAVDWFESQCSPYHANTAFHAVRELIRGLAGVDPTETIGAQREQLRIATSTLPLPAESHALLCGLVGIPLDGPPPPLTPQRGRQLTVQALVGLVTTAAAKAPLCLVFEDLHWVDPSSLEFLAAVVDQIHGAPLFALFTSRPGFEAPWSGRSDVTVLNLPRLSKRHIKVLIAELTTEEALPGAVVEGLIAHTGGVPLFVEELTSMCRDSGWRPDDKASRAARASGPLAGAIPSSLRESLTTRLDLLGPARGTAQLAATLGREFEVDLLRAVSPRDETSLAEDLSDLCRCELLFRRGVPAQAVYTFKHSLVQQAAYESMPKQRRRQLHGLVTNALAERSEAGAPIAPEMLAHHSAAAGQTGRACGFLLTAALAALEGSAMAEAQHHLEQGLQLAATLPDGIQRTHLELTLRALSGVPLMAREGYGSPNVAETYGQAMALMKKAHLSQSPESFPVLWGLWIFHLVRVQYHTALQLADELMALAEGTGDTGLALCAHVARGNTRMLSGNLAGGRADLERALSLYDPVAHRHYAYICGQDPAVQAGSMLSWCVWLLGEPDTALRRSVQTLESARASGHPGSVGFALAMNMVIYQFRNEPVDAERASAELIALAEEQQLVHWLGAAILTHGWALHEQGRREEGIEEMKRGRAMFEMVGALVAMGFHDSLVIQALARNGEADECAQRLGRAKPVVSEEERTFEPEVVRAEGQVRLLLDKDLAGAEACFRAALDHAARIGSPIFELRAALDLGTLWHDRGEGPAARQLVAEVVTRFDQGHDMAELRAARAFLAG